MHTPKRKISYLHRTLVFWCSLGLTAPAYPTQKKVLEEYFVFSARPLSKQQKKSLVSIAKGTVSVVADLEKNGSIKSVTKQLKGTLVYSKEGEAATSLASKTQPRHRRATHGIESHINILSEVQFWADGTCHLSFQTDNPAPFGKGHTPEEILERGEIHVINDIFAHPRLRIETNISRHEMTTEVSVLCQNKTDLQKKQGTKKTPIENDKEFREKRLSSLGYQLLEAHDMAAYPDSILLFNPALNVHGTVKMDLKKEDEYINVAGTCPRHEGCRQKGPSYAYTTPSSTFLCFGHHLCDIHGQVNVGFRPLLFSYISKPKAEEIKLKHIYIKSPITVITTIGSNPLLLAEHKQKKVFVNIDEITALDSASKFLEDSGFNSLIHNSETDASPNFHDHMQKEAPAKNSPEPKLATYASRLSINPRQQPPTDRKPKSKVTSSHQQSLYQYSSPPPSIAPTKTTGKPTQRVSPNPVPQESWQSIPSQKNSPNNTEHQQLIHGSFGTQSSYQLFPTNSNPFGFSLFQSCTQQTPGRAPTKKSIRREPFTEDTTKPQELWSNWYLKNHGRPQVKAFN